MGKLKGVPVGPCSDVYGFGKTCCFALFGTPQPTFQHWQQLPRELADLLGRCLNEQPRARPQDFAALQGGGTTRSHPLLTARFRRTDLETTRFGLATGRGLGGAVVRNRIRRRLREALRAMAPAFQPGWDVLIIARPSIVTADHEAVVGALRRTLVKGGAVGGSAG